MTRTLRSDFPPPLSGDCRIRAAQLLLHSQLDLPISQVAVRLHLTPRHFRRLFQQETGYAPKDYQLQVRIRAAAQRISSGNYERLTDLAYDCAFHDQAHFIATFRQYTGLTPMAYAARYGK